MWNRRAIKKLDRGKIGIACIVALIIGVILSMVVLSKNGITADGETGVISTVSRANIVATGGAVVIEGRPQQKFGVVNDIYAEGFGDVSIGERGTSYKIRDVFWAVTAQDSRGNPFIIYIWND